MNLQKIYQQHKNKVYNLCLHYLQNVEDAEEITQDVFVEVHQSMNTFKGDSQIATWIYRISINKCLDFIKSKKRKKRFAFITSLFSNENDQLIHDPPEFNHPGIQLEQKEGLKRVFSCINELPDNQKTALILNKIEGKSQIEIAEIMNLSSKAVESLVQRAKVNLQKKLDQSEGS